MRAPVVGNRGTPVPGEKGGVLAGREARVGLAAGRGPTRPRLEERECESELGRRAERRAQSWQTTGSHNQRSSVITASAG